MDGLGLNDWELRPGGMLVQKRSSSSSPFSGPLLQLKVSHGLQQHDITIPSEATFGDLKWVLAPLTNLDPKKQSLFFRDQEREDSVHLHLAGVGENSMILLLDPVSKERKRQNEKEAKRHPSILAHKKEEKTNKPKQVRRVKFADNTKVQNSNPFQDNDVSLNTHCEEPDRGVVVPPSSKANMTMNWERFD